MQKRKGNLKQRIIIREKKRKFKVKMKKLTCLTTVALMVLSIVNPQILAYATSIKNTKQILKTQVEYNEDYSKANIKFDLNNIDKEKYEIRFITSDKDGKTIYDKNQVTEENKSEEFKYETTENGSYKFTVKYIEKQRKKVQVLKETESESVSGAEIAKNTEEVIENNTDTEKQPIENKEEKSIPEDTIFQEEKIVVDISKIKTVETEVNTQKESEEIKEESNENGDSTSEIKNTVSENKIEEISENIDNEIASEFSLSNESVNLKDSFKLSGIKSDFDQNRFDNIDSSYYQINPKNMLSIGKHDTTFVRQSIALTSKYSVDFNRDFEISGQVNLSSLPDGFAIGFHTNPNYINKNAGGSLGVYSEPGYPHANAQGIPNGIVLEADTWNNFYDSNNGNYHPFGDNSIDYPSDSSGKHLAVNYTNSSGVVTGTLNKYNISNIFDKSLPFKISWDVDTNIIRFDLGSETISAEVKSRADVLKKSEVYYTIGTVLCLKDGRYNDKNVLSVNSFRYMDIEPEVTTEYSTRYAFPYLGEKFGVKHKVFNKINSSADVEVPLYLEDFSVYDKDNPDDETGKIKLNINGKIQYSYTGGQSDSEWVDFDDQESLKSGQPLMVKLPKNQKPIYIRYTANLPNNIRNPEYKDYGASYEIKNIVLAGEKGMSQFRFDFRANIVTKPAIWSEKEGASNKKIENEFIKVSDKSEITKENMWKGIKAKASHHDVKSLNNGYSTKALIPTNVEIRDYSYFTENLDGIKTEYNKRFPTISDDVMFYGLTINVGVEGLTNTFTTRFYLDDLTIQDNLILKAQDFEVSETKLNIMNEATFKKFVLDESKANLFNVNTEGELTKLDKNNLNVEVSEWINSYGYADKNVGIYPIKISGTNEGKSIDKNINIDVTENTWSYSTPDRTEENGASGYIVIPKSIELKNGSGRDKDKIVATEKVYFANYETEKEYFVYTDKNFKIRNEKNGSEVEVTTIANGNYDGVHETIGRLNVDRTEDNPLTFKLRAPNTEVNKTKGQWKGNMIFRFELQQQ